MTNSYEEAVKRIFENLSKWRCLPKYQLERRADMFFGLYIREIVQYRLKLEMSDKIIPEFPIKKQKNNEADKKDNRSCNVDYVVFSANGKKMVFVELKTDSSSLDAGQVKFYTEIIKSEKNLQSLKDDICDISKSSRSKAKYEKLLTLLDGQQEISPEDMKVLFIVPDMNEKSYELDKTLDKVEFITFSEISALLLERDPDEFTKTFCQNLMGWKEKADK